MNWETVVSIRDHMFQAVTWMTSEFSIQTLLFGQDWEFQDYPLRHDMVTPWIFQAVISSCLEDGHKILEIEISTFWKKIIVNISKFGVPKKCAGRMVNTLEIHQHRDMVTQLQQLDLIYLFLEDGNSQKLSMKLLYSENSTKPNNRMMD